MPVPDAGSRAGIGGVLPRLLVLTDRRRCRHRLVDILRAAVDAGARAVVVREKDLPDHERRALAAEVAALLAPVEGLVLVASGPVAPPGPTGVRRGVHLAAADPWPGRPDAGTVVGRSCHDAAEVGRAVAEGVDHLTVSPVHPTPSKPGYGPALGPDGLAALVALAAGTPVYALGGITPAAVPGCLGAGAHGVAVMGGIMAAPDPGAATADLLAALDAAAAATVTVTATATATATAVPGDR